MDSLKCPGEPCLLVPRCPALVSFNVSQLSSGSGPSRSSSQLSLCWDPQRLWLQHDALGQLQPQNYCSQCNCDIYSLSAVEMFIAPYMEAEPQCYNGESLSLPSIILCFVLIPYA